MHFTKGRSRPSAGRLLSRLTYANIVATLALFIALAGGTAYAASKLITGKQIAKNTITATNIKSGSLLSTDFKKGQLPKGATGATGPAGPAGPTGATGATGAAGSAVAYATVELNGEGNVVFVANSGFTSVTEVSTSPEEFCLAAASSTILGHPAVFGDDGSYAGVPGLIPPNQCANGVQVEAQNMASGGGFTIAIL